MAKEIKNCGTCYHWDRKKAFKCEPGQFEGKRCSNCLLNMWARFDDDKCENWMEWKPTD